MWSFDSINHVNELYLIQTDDKYGEWGGNTYFMRIYRDSQTNLLKIDYTEYKGQVGPPLPPDPESNLIVPWLSGQPIIRKKHGHPVNTVELKLISSAIQGLLKYKLNKEEIPAMAGVVNKIVYSDSTLILSDYPSTRWDELQILKGVLTKN